MRAEAVLALQATAPASNVETTVMPFLGARLGHFAANGGDGDTVVGFDGALFVGTITEGTDEVRSSRTLSFAEARGMYAPARVASTYSALAPYGFMAASAGAGLVEVRAFEDARYRLVPTWGTRVGLGAELQLHALVTRIELGFGQRDLRFEVSSGLTVGVAL